jgi:hypothetical protein
MGAYSSTHLTPEEIQELEDKTHCQCDQLDPAEAHRSREVHGAIELALTEARVARLFFFCSQFQGDRAAVPSFQET